MWLIMPGRGSHFQVGKLQTHNSIANEFTSFVCVKGLFSCSSSLYSILSKAILLLEKPETLATETQILLIAFKSLNILCLKLHSGKNPALFPNPFILHSSKCTAISRKAGSSIHSTLLLCTLQHPVIVPQRSRSLSIS